MVVYSRYIGVFGTKKISSRFSTKHREMDRRLFSWQGGKMVNTLDRSIYPEVRKTMDGAIKWLLIRNVFTARLKKTAEVFVGEGCDNLKRKGRLSGRLSTPSLKTIKTTPPKSESAVVYILICCTENALRNNIYLLCGFGWNDLVIDLNILAMKGRRIVTIKPAARIFH